MIDLDGNECEPDAPECPVLVFATKYVTAWPDGATLGESTEPWDLLTRLYGTDAHFAAYSCERNVRLKTESLRDSSAEMRLFVVDVDRVTEEPIEAWRVRMARLTRALRGSPFAYFTRNGLRLVWRIKPRVIASASDAREWSRWYVRQIVFLSTLTGGMVADPACRDWTRLFRVPHGVRDGVEQAHGHCTPAYADGGPLAGPAQSPNPGEWVEAPVDERVFESRIALLARDSDAWAQAKRSLEPQAFDTSPSTVASSAEKAKGAQKAIELASSRVCEALPGVRNEELFRQAAWLYRLVKAGELIQGPTERALLEAALTAGLSRSEAIATLKSARRSVLA